MKPCETSPQRHFVLRDVVRTPRTAHALGKPCWYRPASRRAFHQQPRVAARRTATIDLFAAGRALGIGQAAHMFSPQPRTPPSHASLHQSRSYRHIPEHSKTTDAALLLQTECWRVAELARSGQRVEIPTLKLAHQQNYGRTE